MPDKKYQVFVSSTHDDLKPHRAEISKAILTLGHIPLGMELFSAADDESWQVIKRTMAQADYYVVIVAHRYGSQKAGVSYTEMEFDLAVGLGIPVLGFVIHKSAPWDVSLSDRDGPTIAKLDHFKGKIKSRNVDFWSNEHDLSAKVSVSLVKQIALKPGVGWIRADQAASPETINELARLSQENAKLRAKEDAAASHSHYAIERFISAVWDLVHAKAVEDSHRSSGMRRMLAMRDTFETPASEIAAVELSKASLMVRLEFWSRPELCNAAEEIGERALHGKYTLKNVGVALMELLAMYRGAIPEAPPSPVVDELGAD